MPVRRLAAVGALLAAGLLAGCGVRMARPPALDMAGRAERYHVTLLERRARGVAVSANLTLWLERASMRRLPGASADLVLAAPDRLRLRVASAFGTMLDLGVRGDSLLAYVPAWRTGLRLGSARESLGVSEPGDLAFRVLAAAWEPPGEAWSRAVWRDSLLEVSWVDAEDSVSIGVDRQGLPVWARLVRPPVLDLRARYRAWDRSAGVPWPAVIEVDDPVHQVRLVCKASQLRFRPQADPARLTVRMPARAMTLTLQDLRSVLDRLGTN
jgi:hypothetical protein